MARAEVRIGGRQRKLADKQRAESAALSGRKTAAEMVRLYRVSQRRCRGL